MVKTQTRQALYPLFLSGNSLWWFVLLCHHNRSRVDLLIPNCVVIPLTLDQSNSWTYFEGQFSLWSIPTFFWPLKPEKSGWKKLNFWRGSELRVRVRRSTTQTKLSISSGWCCDPLKSLPARELKAFWNQFFTRLLLLMSGQFFLRQLPILITAQEN